MLVLRHLYEDNLSKVSSSGCLFKDIGLKTSHQKISHLQSSGLPKIVCSSYRLNLDVVVDMLSRRNVCRNFVLRRKGIEQNDKLSEKHFFHNSKFLSFVNFFKKCGLNSNTEL